MFKNDKLTEIDLWRLSDCLPVTAAASLIAGHSPNDRFLSQDGDFRFYDDHDGEKERRFSAVIQSLRSAILSNRLAADIRLPMRRGGTTYDVDYTPQMPHENSISYDLLLTRMDNRNYGPPTVIPGKTRLNFSVDDLRNETDFYICSEPSWSETLVDVEHLKEWLKKRGVFPSFFFPTGNEEGFRNKDNPRYSPKLACAVAAWEAVKKPNPNKSVKQTLADWIQSNGVNLGLGVDGVVSPSSAEEIAKVCNWATSGGANATWVHSEDEASAVPQVIENYPHGYPEQLPERSDYDDEIPF